MRLRCTFFVFAALALAPLSVPASAVEKDLPGRSDAAGAIPQQDRQDRPIPMGVSIGNTPSLPFIYAGTAGLLVRSLANPAIKYILSNNHVLGAKGPGLCPNSATPGSWSLQPGTLDIGNDPENNPFYVAGLVASFQPLVRPGVNLVDAAMSITAPALAKTEILGIGEPNPAVGVAMPGMNVTKGGRTTGVTNGRIDSVNATVNVGYGPECGNYLFVGQTMIDGPGFSAGGDSGSSILESSTKTPVGLLFAGSPTQTVANQIVWTYLLFGVFPDSPAAAGPSSIEDLSRMRAAAEARMDPRIGRLAQVQQRHETQILAIPGVEAIGIGLDGGDMVFKVYGSVESQRALPQTLEGVRVVFRESGGKFTAR